MSVMESSVSYDPRYLAGIVLFNRGDFFEAHEVWEDLWMETAGDPRRFYQGLIQAAVGLCHFCNGNVRGALKLYRSARDYMQRFGPHHLGLDVAEFWRQMELCYAELLHHPDLDERTETQRIEPDVNLFPNITLNPPPEAWPDPAAFLPKEEEA
jgi:predicted metal-dependent hydrolase